MCHTGIFFCRFSGGSSLGLRTSQFLEQLRQNPTMGIMRDELATLLDEKVEKCGIPHGTTGISDQMLQNKLGMQHTQRQSYLQVCCLNSYVILLEIESQKWTVYIHYKMSQLDIVSRWCFVD